MSVFASKNLRKNLDHDDRVIRSVALGMLTGREGSSPALSKAILNTIQNRGFHEAFSVQASQFASPLDNTTTEDLLCLLENIQPSTDPAHLYRISNLFYWLEKAPKEIIFKEKERIKKLANSLPLAEDELSPFWEKMHLREQWSNQSAETLRIILEELIEDASITMAEAFPEYELLLILELCPILSEKKVISSELQQKWIAHEFDSDRIDHKAEIQHLTALELATISKTDVPFEILFQNLKSGQRLKRDLAYQHLVATNNRQHIEKIFDNYRDAPEDLRSRMTELFLRLSAPDYADLMVATLGKEPCGELSLYHAHMLASTGTYSGIALAESAANQYIAEYQEEPIEAIQALYTYYTLAEKPHPQIPKWKATLEEDARMQEELQRILAEEEERNAHRHSPLDNPPLFQPYDPNLPQPGWLELSADEKYFSVLDYIETHEWGTSSIEEHLQAHILIENQIAMEDRTPIAAALQRLISEGFSRHTALHAISTVFIETVLMMENESPESIDQAYFKKIENLTATEWLAEYAPEDLPPPRHTGGKIGRNDPCPCGSGKKYKQCCLKFAN